MIKHSNSRQAKITTVGVVVPIFNVEKTIGSVLESLSEALESNDLEILIIDNDSSDNTLRLAKICLSDNPKLNSKVTILKSSRNYGYGCSIKTGFDYFLSKDVTHIMIIHGDYQVEPAWLVNELITSINKYPAIELVLGSRFEPESNISSYSTLRKIGNYFFNNITRLCSGHRMSDSGTAMIVIKKDLLRQVPYQTLSNSWQFHPQLNIFLYQESGAKIMEIPINWSDSTVDSTVPLFRYGVLLLNMLLIYWFKKNILRLSSDSIFPREPIPPERRVEVISI